jgi:hypothetical protein
MTAVLSRLEFYNENLRVAVLVDAILAALSYVARVISGTIHGIGISKIQKHKRCVGTISEKVTGERCFSDRDFIHLTSISK